MDQSANRPELPANLPEHFLDLSGIAHVHRAIHRGGPGRPNLLQVVADFALRQHFSVLRFNLFGRAPIPGPGQQGPLQFGCVRNAGQPFRFALGQQAPSQQHQPQASQPRQLQDRFGRNAASPAGHHHQVSILQYGKPIAGGQRHGLQLQTEPFAGKQSNFYRPGAEHFLGDGIRHLRALLDFGVEVDCFAVNLRPFMPCRLEQAGQPAADRVAVAIKRAKAKYAVQSRYRHQDSAAFNSPE